MPRLHAIKGDDVKRLMAVATLVTTSALMGQGYDKTTWGMTEAQVRALYPERTFQMTNKTGDPMKPGEVFSTAAILGASMECVFHFGSTGLDHVNLSMPVNAEPAGAIGEISVALHVKYGKPSETNMDTKTRTRTWIMADTLVTERLDQIGNTWVFGIDYQIRKAAR
jgi:hypothetical protein